MRRAYPILLLPLLAACHEALPGERPAREFVSFSAHADSLDSPTTRVMEFGYWQAGMQLMVYSWETNTTRHFRDFRLTYNAPYTTSWTYVGPIEQPEVSVSYYAWRPYTGGMSNFVADGFTGGFDYTVPTQTEDLFVSKSISSSARVPMFFFHPLTEVNFAVQGIADYRINVTNIKINEVKNSGHLTIETWNAGTWTDVGGLGSYDYIPDYGTPHDEYVPRPLPTDGTNNDIIYLGNMGGWRPRDNDRRNAMMLMPQSFDAPGEGGYMSFDYTIDRTDGTRYKEGSAVGRFADFSNHTWAKGRRYIYIIDCRGLMEDPQTRATQADEALPELPNTQYIRYMAR